MAEVYAWPEATLYLWSGNATATAMIFAEDVRLTIDWRWEKRQTFATAGGIAGRTRFTLAEKNVGLSLGQAWASQEVVLFLQSATAFNAALSGSSLIQTAGYKLCSAVCNQWSLAGAQGGIFGQRVEIMAADVSAA